MEIRQYELLRTLDRCGHGQIKKVPYTEFNPCLQHDDDRLARLVADAEASGWIERGSDWTKITERGLKQINEYEPILLEEILLMIDGQPGTDFTGVLRKLPITCAAVTFHLREQFELELRWLEFQDWRVFTTSKGKEALQKGKRKRDTMTIFGIVKPRKVIEEAVHNALVNTLSTAITLIIGFGFGMLTKDWVIGFWRKVFGG